MNDKFEMLLLNYDILKFMRRIFLFALLLISKLIFAQDTATIKEINKLIGPEFKFRNEIDFSDDNYFAWENANENILVVNSHKRNNDGDLEFEKIFVFSKNKNQFQLIDSSSRFERDGKGPSISFSKDTIALEHNHHGGGYNLIYKFNSVSKKYFLTEIKNHQGGYNKDHFIKTEQVYDVIAQKLFYKREEQLVDGWKTIKTEKKVIEIAPPKNFKIKLSEFLDPELYAEKVYDKIFQ